MSRPTVRDQIMTLLKLRGAQTAADLAEELGVSPMAIRQHLQSLKAEAWVSYREDRRPMGRPVKLWHLTEQARSRFPDSHSDLVLDLLRSTERVFGEEGVNRIIAERQERQVQNYRQQLAECGAGKDWKETAVAIAHFRHQEGYMAEVLTETEDSLLLVENHCPICVAAQSCHGLCRAELEVFQTLLGSEVTVERVEHILQGDRRCAYRVEKRPNCPSAVTPQDEESV